VNSSKSSLSPSQSIHSSPVTDHFERLRKIVAQLRAPGGCPWDREQTNASLAPKLVEEVYEAVAAVQNRDDANLSEELGDVLLLVLMHAEIAREENRFDIDDVIEKVTAKIIHRHPHVFGASKVRDSAGVVRQWDAIKLEEKEEPKRNYLADVGAALPALMRAQKIQRKAAHVHFDWREPTEVMGKVDEELAETKAAIESASEEKVAEEIGDLLFAIVNLARKRKLDAETLLQSASDKFVRRFHALEDVLRAQGKNLGDVALDALDEIWNAQKIAR
jgi:MazG family protein